MRDSFTVEAISPSLSLAGKTAKVPFGYADPEKEFGAGSIGSQSHGLYELYLIYP
ncbi:MAG: hypothetical protein HOJ31_04970 [Anaerolineae bacterium]|nr:hypothetical protein [Anaerolineae bacterium]